ncbi:hypothetical protein BC829DRAFT_474861 [Chytridium lagenaria]|nr:hypothetical protein BC829DRAFT_474861 [Chytridium lagenaria]
MCMGFSGHNAVFGCRYCTIEGEYSARQKTYYYPLVPRITSKNLRRGKLQYDAMRLTLESLKRKRVIFVQAGTSFWRHEIKHRELNFGRPPSNIFEDKGGLKSEEWKNWCTLISVPLMKTFLPDKDLLAWSRFADVIQFCHNCLSFDEESLEWIEKGCYEFYSYYEKNYYGYKEVNLPACTSVFHYVLHISDVIREMGQCGPTGSIRWRDFAAC